MAIVRVPCEERGGRWRSTREEGASWPRAPRGGLDLVGEEEATFILSLPRSSESRLVITTCCPHGPFSKNTLKNLSIKKDGASRPS